MVPRVSARRANASDADAAVVRKQIAIGDAAENWVWIDARGDLQSVLTRASAAL
ncbi:hypothetical protein [uncultured Roseovarius sp.]|uniref:hypothetical protein n=1 Tax=uncultured Roseovarius sp. TaxID=293344 RepID=UPI0025E4D9B7|nr:hypothetical protein [uncultured Roseovarius sp.]